MWRIWGMDARIPCGTGSSNPTLAHGTRKDGAPGEPVVKCLENSAMLGKCRLCLEQRELQFSHLLPKALYRLVGRVSNPVHPDTVQVTLNDRRKSSEQSRRHILCFDCEQRLNTVGERWILQNCYRGRGVFRLRTELRKRSQLERDSTIEAYSASPEEVATLAYFSLSVVWRASLCDWPARGRTYHPIRLGPYQERVRKYLKGETGIPPDIALIATLSQLAVPVLAFSLPISYLAEGCRCHRFHIPGICFVIAVGKATAKSWPDICILRNPLRPIIISTVNDEQTQEQIMRLMGKVAPPWGKYPLINGVERFKVE
jgi:hypothetical protein